MYYTNIANSELQYFRNLTVNNFTIKLSDVLTSGLFKVDEIITDKIYKVYPLFYTKTITSSNSIDKILDNRCIICQKQEKETYLTFISDENKEVQDYQSYASYYDIDDSLTQNQFNSIISLLRHNIIHNDTFNILEETNGNYGKYSFNVDDCTITDMGIVIDLDTRQAQPKVMLTDNVFHYSTYTLQLSILHYTGVNILDDNTDDYKVIDTIEMELTPKQWVNIPLTDLEDGYIISSEVNVKITHDKPVISDYIQTIEVTSEPSIIQTGETSEIYATGYDNGHVPVSTGHTIHFFEKIEPIITVSASQSIIQTSDNTEIYAKVKDSDGSLAQNVQVHFYQQPEAPVPTTLSVVADNPVLSYSDGDSAVLSATVRDQYSLPMSNQSVVFKVGDTVLDTVTTDGNGKAEYEYTSQGSGDVTFTVECGNLQETYELEDCKFYDASSSSNVNKYSVESGTSFSYDSSNSSYSLYPTSAGARGVTLNSYTFSKDNKVSIDFNITNAPINAQYGFLIGNICCRAIKAGSIQRITISNNEASSDYTYYDHAISTQEWYTLELLPTGVLNLKQGETIIATCNYDISSIQGDTNNFKIYSAHSSDTRGNVKNIKIKPL